MYAFEMGKARWHFEAVSLEADRAVGPPLHAAHLGAEGAAQDFRWGTFAADIGTGAIALKRRASHLAVARVVVVKLDPGVRRSVEQLQRQVLHVFQHGHQSAFKLR